MQSASARWNVFNWIHEGLNLFSVKPAVFANCAGRLLLKAHPLSASCGRANWPGTEAATAVGANIFQNRLHAIHAECAFIAADASLARVGRKITITQFAVGSDF